MGNFIDEDNPFFRKNKNDIESLITEIESKSKKVTQALFIPTLIRSKKAILYTVKTYCMKFNAEILL